jgi:hypothetical protein
MELPLLAATALCYCNTVGICSGDQYRRYRAKCPPKNTGIGESVNFNDSQNLYKASVEEQECEFEDQKSKQVGLTSHS